MDNFYHIKSKYLADALAFLGFRYFIFENKLTTNIRSYGFVDNESFRCALSELTSLKNKYKQ